MMMQMFSFFSCRHHLTVTIMDDLANNSGGNADEKSADDEAWPSGNASGNDESEVRFFFVSLSHFFNLVSPKTSNINSGRTRRKICAVIGFGDSRADRGVTNTPSRISPVVFLTKLFDRAQKWGYIYYLLLTVIF